MENMNIDPGQVAVLIDQVGRLMTETTNVRTDIQHLRVEFARFETVPAQVTNLQSRVDSHTSQLSQLNFIVKLGAAVLLSCVGVIGWGWKEYSSLKARDDSMDRRLLLIEFKLGVPSEPDRVAPP